MEVSTRKEKGAAVVSANGRIDAVSASDFEKALSELIEKGENIILINFSSVDYISSAGLRSILMTAKKLKENQGKILFTGLQGPVKDVFKMSGFYSLFSIHDSEETALNSI